MPNHQKNKTLFFCFILLFLIINYKGYSQKNYQKDSIAYKRLYETAIDLKVENPEQIPVRIDSALTFLNAKILPYKKHDTVYALQKAKLLEGEAFFMRRRGEMENALKSYQGSIKLREKYDDGRGVVNAYDNIAQIWGMLDNLKKAKENIDLASASLERDIKKYNTGEGIRSMIMTSYANYYRGIEKLDSTHYYYKKAIEIAEKAKDSGRIANYNKNYAQFLMDEGIFNEALPYLEKGMQLDKARNNVMGIQSNLYSIAKVHNQSGNYNQAIKEYLEYLATYKESGYGPSGTQALLELSQAYEATGNFKEAHRYFKEYKEAFDKASNLDQIQKLADQDANFKYAKQKAVDSTQMVQQKYIEQTQLEKKANTKFWIVVSSLLLLLSLITIFYIIYRNRAREQALRNELLNQEVSEKTEEITELLTETVQHIKSKERIAENLQKLSNEQEGVSLKSIMADLKASKADNAKLMLIKQNIEQVNFSFIKKLKNEHPELTKTDIEICSFIRIGLSRKEIADLRNTSIEAIKSSRFRIKKKLNIAENISLDDYINSL